MKVCKPSTLASLTVVLAVVQEVGDAYRKPRVRAVCAGDEDPGGLDIAAARRRLQEEDKFDKELHRQKIKQRHRVCGKIPAATLKLHIHSLTMSKHSTCRHYVAGW